jgi:hypothetical protein
LAKQRGLREDKRLSLCREKTNEASMTIHIHQDDLPADIDLGNLVAIDTETMGLNPHRDRLCLVQLWALDCARHGERGLGAFGSLGISASQVEDGMVSLWAPFDLVRSTCAARGVVSTLRFSKR